MHTRQFARRAQLLAGTTTFADMATPLVLPWYGYDVSHSLALMAIMFLAEALLPVMAGLGLSALLGRMASAALIKWGQGGRAVLFTALLGVAELHNHDLVWTALVIASGINGLCSVLAESAIQSAIPGEGQELTTMAERIQRAITVMKMIGAPVGAILIASVGPDVTVGALAASALASGLAGAAWLPTQTDAPAVVTPTTGQWTEGFHKLWRMPVIRSLALQAMTGNFGWSLVTSGFLFYLLHTLHVTGNTVSGVYLIIAIGSVAGTFVVTPLLGRFRRGRLYPVFLLGGVLGLLMLQWPSPWAAALGEGIVGLCDTAWVVLSTGVRLERIPSSDRSLVLTTSRLLSNSLVPVGGIIVALWGIHRGFGTLFGLAAGVKALEVVIAKTTAVGHVDEDACCAVAAMRVAG